MPPTHDARLSIGRFSYISGLSVKTLRYYDEAGLLKPASTDPDSGYRYYAREQLRTVYVIRDLKIVGTSLEGIHGIVNGPTAERLRDMYDRSVRDLEAEMVELSVRLRSARRLRDHPLPDGPHEVREFEREGRPFVFLRYRYTMANVEEARWAAFTELRAYLVRRRVLPTSPPTCWFPMRKPHEAHETYAGFEVDEPVPDEGRVRCGSTPSGRFYQVRHYGLYEHLGGTTMYAVRERLQADGLATDVTRGSSLSSETYMAGPWDTTDAGDFCTDFVWVARIDDPGCVVRTPESATVE